MGQQLVRDRALTYAFFSPSESAAVPSFLFCTGPYQTGGSASSDTSSAPWLTHLYAIPYGKDVGAVAELASLEPAVEDLAPLSYSVVSRSPATDSLGRLFLATLRVQDSPSSTMQTSDYRLTRYDPRTGARDSVPSGAFLRMSASRNRVLAGESRSATLFEPQGSRPLTSISGLPIFVGEDLYYVAVPPSDSPLRPPTSSTIMRIKPNAEPEAIISFPGYLTITAIQAVETTRLLVSRGAVTAALPGLFVLDVDTLVSTPLPSGLAHFSFVAASSSGRWLVFVGTAAPSDPTAPPQRTMTIVDWIAGTRTDLDLSVIGELHLGSSPPVAWRPGHDELWVRTDKGTFKITEPGDIVTPVVLPPGLALADHPQEGTSWSSNFMAFTPDGLYWFARNPYVEGSVYVGRADDPSSPAIQINPEGTWTKPYWDIGDGRLLVGAWADDESRQELYLVDLAAGTSQVLAGGGQVAAVGRTRALVLLQWDGALDVGTLTLIDLASGVQTMLAEEVYGVAVDPGRSADVPPGTDALAPGTKIAFLSRGRLASPYDGLWTTELP